MTEYEQGDRVAIRIPAYVLEEYDAGDMLVDADGKEILVAADEVEGKWI